MEDLEGFAFGEFHGAADGGGHFLGGGDAELGDDGREEVLHRDRVFRLSPGTGRVGGADDATGGEAATADEA